MANDRRKQEYVELVADSATMCDCCRHIAREAEIMSVVDGYALCIDCYYSWANYEVSLPCEPSQTRTEVPG